jgi:hypothetical protein
VLTHLSTALKRPVVRLRQVKFAAALLPEESTLVSFDTTGQYVGFSVTTQRDGVAVTLASGSVLLAEAATAPR